MEKEKQNKKKTAPKGNNKTKITVLVSVLALILAIIFICSLFITGTPRSAKTADNDEAESMAQHIAITDQYINEGRADIVKNAAAAIGEPETFEEYYLCASADIEYGDLDGAAEMLDKCIELFEGDDAVLSQLNLKQGSVLATQGKLSRAREYLETAVKLDGSNSDAWLTLAQVEYQSEDYAEALKSLETYQSKGGEMNGGEYSLLASIQLFTGNYKDAQKSCDEAIKKEGGDEGEIFFLRCKADYFLKDYAACGQDAQKALDAGYDYNECMTMKAAACEGVKDYAGVLAVLMQMIDDGVEDSEVYQNALAAANEAKDYAAQEKILLRLLEYETDLDTEITLRSSLAAAQIQLKKYDEALENLEKCISARPDDNTRFIYLRGVCFLNQKQYNKAYNDFTSVIKKKGELVDASRYNRALCLIGLGGGYTAQEELKELINTGTDEEMIAKAQELLDKF